MTPDNILVFPSFLPFWLLETWSEVRGRARPNLADHESGPKALGGGIWLPRRAKSVGSSRLDKAATLRPSWRMIGEKRNGDAFASNQAERI